MGDELLVDSLVEEELRKQAEAHGLQGWQGVEEDDEVEAAAEERLRMEHEQLISFAGLRPSSEGFASAQVPSLAPPLVPVLTPLRSTEEVLAVLGPVEMKDTLHSLGLKCGGTPQERAARLFKLKGVTSLSDVDSSLFVKSSQPVPTYAAMKRKRERVEKGPLLPYQSRRHDQKKLPKSS